MIVVIFRNGMLLCRNCHSLYDSGAFIFPDEYRMVVLSEVLRAVDPWSSRHNSFRLDFSDLEGEVSSLVGAVQNPCPSSRVRCYQSCV